MSNVSLAMAILTVPFMYLSAIGQHCAPIVESYLESVAIKRAESGIALDINYRKTGGQAKESYQAYLLAFAQKDAGRLAAMTPQEAIESKVASIVHTQRMKRQENGCYRIECSLGTPSFVAAMLADGRIDPREIDDFGGWKSFKGKIRFAVFVPFLEDKKYSVIDGLPENRHECNYREESALIFETLSPTVSVHFGIVQAIPLPENQYSLQINGHRPLASAKEGVK